MRTKLASTEADIKRILQKRCFGDISHVFFGSISQVLHRYFSKDLPRFSEQRFSRTALKCCLSSVIYSSGKQYQPGHFLQSQGKKNLPFLYTLFRGYFYSLKIVKKYSGQLYYTQQSKSVISIYPFGSLFIVRKRHYRK